MQASAIQYLFSITLLAVTLGCGSLREILWVASKAPDGRNDVEITKRLHGADASIAIRLRRGGKAISVYSDNADRMPKFAEVYWSGDSSVLGVLVCDAASAEKPIIMNYDLLADRHMPPERVMPALRKVLTLRYDLNLGALAEFNRDPITWACSQFSDSAKRFSDQLDGSRGLSGVAVN